MHSSPSSHSIQRWFQVERLNVTEATEAIAAPFASRCSARWMHEVTGALCARYRLRGVAVITYLNDKLYAKPGFVPTARQRNTVVPHCEQLGFRYKRNKVPLPRRPIDFLGITAHLAAPACRRPPSSNATSRSPPT